MGILQRFQEGGIFMYFILAFGICSLGFILERSRALYLLPHDNGKAIRQHLISYFRRGDMQGACDYLKSLRPQSITRILQKACELRMRAGGEEELQSRMDEALAEEVSQIDRRTGFLAMFGNVATLLGLLGTITGMIHSFGAVGNANPAERAVLLSRGISEAMNCTAFGLIVAIPALVCYAIFQARTEALVSELTDITAKIYHDLIFLLEPGTNPNSARARVA